MPPVIAISDLQKTLKTSFDTTPGLSVVLSNNKKRGAIIGQKFLKFIEQEGIWEMYEDYLLMNNVDIQERSNEAEEIMQTGDYSKTLGFDEL